MYTIETSQDYIEYFENLKKYLLENFGEKVQKKAIKNEKEKFENLKSFPYMGKDAKELSKFLSGYRVIIDKHEYLFYQVVESKKIISVELAISTKEDVIQRLEKHFS